MPCSRLSIPRAADCTVAGSLACHDDLADLNHRTSIGVVRDIGQALLRMRTESRLKGLNRLAENVAHRHVRGRRTGSAARESLVHRVVLAAHAHPGLYQRHVFVAVVLMVESHPGRARVHHADFDHRSTPWTCGRYLQPTVGAILAESPAG